MQDLKTVNEERVAAETRARCCFEEHLSPRQREEFERFGSFSVEGRQGVRYAIHYEPHFEAVVVLESTNWRTFVKGRYSALPLGDLLLAALLMIQGDEQDFVLQSRQCGSVWIVGG